MGDTSMSADGRSPRPWRIFRGLPGGITGTSPGGAASRVQAMGRADRAWRGYWRFVEHSRTGEAWQWKPGAGWYQVRPKNDPDWLAALERRQKSSVASGGTGGVVPSR